MDQGYYSDLVVLQGKLRSPEFMSVHLLLDPIFLRNQVVTEFIAIYTKQGKIQIFLLWFS